MVEDRTGRATFAVRVEQVEPPTYVAYRWTSAFPAEGGGWAEVFDAIKNGAEPAYPR